MNELPVPIEYESPEASTCMSDASHRRVALAFAALGLAVAVFSLLWGRQLEFNHILAEHGCACSKLNPQDLTAFGGLPLVAALCVYGTGRAGFRAAVWVAGLGLVGTVLVYADLWSAFFGWSPPHLFS